MGDREVDQQLVERAQRGDKRAFELLVTKYQRKLGRLLSRLVRDPAEVEDVTQEAFIKAYRALPSFRGDSAFYTWLYRIAINTAKNALVASRRRPVSYDLDLQDGSQVQAQTRLSDSETPEALALTDEIRRTVNEAIEALPDDLRLAIVLRELEGLSYEDIAKTMECPVGTVRSRIFRAREAIDRSLREVFDGGLGRIGDFE
jgi:RNA polymerase sigma-70 factor, ECF subfamily